MGATPGRRAGGDREAKAGAAGIRRAICGRHRPACSVQP